MGHWHRIYYCRVTRKRKFASAEEAVSFHDERFPGTYRRAYICPDCGEWHLTTHAMKDVHIVRDRIGA